jgi:hypothetical protein
MHSPPVDLSAPSTGSWVFTILCAVLLSGATIWALQRASKGDNLGLFALAGGFVASLIEAMLDNLGLLWFATDNHAIVFHAFGRSMPFFVVAGYAFYFGAMAYYTVYAIGKGKSGRYLWGIYAFGWVFDWALETTGSGLGLYHYYGPQPFNVFDIPLWWMFINPALPIAAGALFHVMRDQLKGVRGVLVVLLLPMTYGAIYGAIGWPIFVALNSNVADVVIWGAAVLTIAQALLLVHLTISGLEWYRRTTGDTALFPRTAVDRDASAAAAPDPPRPVVAAR